MLLRWQEGDESRRADPITRSVAFFSCKAARRVQSDSAPDENETCCSVRKETIVVRSALGVAVIPVGSRYSVERRRNVFQMPLTRSPLLFGTSLRPLLLPADDEIAPPLAPTCGPRLGIIITGIGFCEIDGGWIDMSRDGSPANAWRQTLHSSLCAERRFRDQRRGCDTLCCAWRCGAQTPPSACK